jgi:hypothetical protein
MNIYIIYCTYIYMYVHIHNFIPYDPLRV